MWAIFKNKNDINEKSIIGFISFFMMVLFGIVDLGSSIAVGKDLVINEEQYKIANHILEELLEPNRKYYKRYKEAGVNLLVISQNLLTQMRRWQNIRVYNPATKRDEIRPGAGERKDKLRTYHDPRGR